MEPVAKILCEARAAAEDGDSLPETDEIFESIAESTKKYMSAFDASHDFSHVLRVVALSQRILAAERQAGRALGLDSAVIILAAFLHDVNDKKYTNGTPAAPGGPLQLLQASGVSATVASKVVNVVENVSYSTETRNPEKAKSALETWPELGVVQDADRLDAIGAIGIGRAFTFGGAKMPLSDMQLSREHMTEKLERLESMMKTETGRALAKERTRRIQVFCQWWDEEYSAF